MPSLKELSILYIGIVVPAAELVPLSIALYKYRQLDAVLRIVVWYLAMGMLFCVLTSVLAFCRVNNMPVMHIYTMAEGSVLLYLYSRVLKKGVFRKAIPICAAIFLLFCVLNLLFFQKITDYNSYSKSLEAIIVVALSMSYFTSALNTESDATARDRALLYINSGILLYFAASLILFIILNVDPRFLKAHILIWDVHATFLLLLFVLFSLGLWKYRLR